MLDFLSSHVPCLASFLSNPYFVGLSLLSFVLAFFSFLYLRREGKSLKRKVAFAYGHVAFLAFPFVLFLYTMSCTALPTACQGMDWMESAALILPATLLVSLLSGLVAVPLLLAASAKSRRYHGPEAQWLQDKARFLGVKPPRLYLVDEAKPQAFSFSSLFSAVFVSLGAFELLSKKEKEAVLLHELGHVKTGASSLKFSALLLKLLTPQAAHAFHEALSAEEKKADEFAASVQGTRAHLESARRKFEAFDR